jgi:single-strand DNA-binding protein
VVLVKRASVKEVPERSGRNEVFLEGRVSNVPVEKQLPSGDSVVEFRLVIDRKKRRSLRREVDTLDVAAWLATPRKRALSLAIGDWVCVEGSIHRRFWKSSTGLASRWQVEARHLKRI